MNSTRIFPFPRASRLLLLLASCTILVSSTEARETTIKRTEFGAGVRTGVYLTKYHDSCIYFRLFFVSDNFFSKLKAKDTPTGKVFKKGADEYRTFPDKFILDVEATVVRCSDPPDTRIILDKSIGFLGSLSFETNWKLSDSEPPATVVVPLKVEQYDLAVLRRDKERRGPARRPDGRMPQTCNGASEGEAARRFSVHSREWRACPRLSGSVGLADAQSWFARLAAP